MIDLQGKNQAIQLTGKATKSAMGKLVGWFTFCSAKALPSS